MRIAALIPTLYRPEGLRRVLQSLRDTAPDVVAVVAYERDDFTAPLLCKEFGAIPAMCLQYKQGCAYGWNTALRAAPDFEAYVIASDDAEFLPGWLSAVTHGLEELNGSGLVGISTDEDKSEYSNFYMMTRDFIIQHHGGVAAVPHYKVWGVDTEACQRAMNKHKYIKVTTARIKHYQAGLPPVAVRAVTKDIYAKRKQRGFVDDYEPVIT